MARAARLALGGALAWAVSIAAAAPQVPRLTVVLALAIAAATLWRPAVGLLAAAAIAPAGALLAAAPARAAEMCAWAFAAAWLLRVWRPLSATGWPAAVAAPAILYGGALVASWLATSVDDSAGVTPLALPRFLLWLIPPDHLVLSSPEPETWTMLQSVTGIGVFLAAIAITRDDRRVGRWMAVALVLSIAGVGIATIGDILRQWAALDFGAWWLLRFAEGERFSLTLQDNNAMGSLYALAMLIGMMAAASERPHRRRWIALVLVMVPGFLLAGSMSALAALIVTAGCVGLARAGVAGWRPTRRHAAAAVTVTLLVIVSAGLLASRQYGRATVTQAMGQRAQFAETSARMLASAPVFGVGVGHYFNRSAEFMPPALREFYGNENAHNYFLQEFAELGLVGGALFVWLILAVVACGFRASASSGWNGTVTALWAGTTAYVITLLTGHPLLVQEAALPFWAAFGAGAALGIPETRRVSIRPALRALAAAAVVLMTLEVGFAARTSRTTTAPLERGFHGLEADPGGEQFRWMTRHGVLSLPPTPGIVTLQLHAPYQPAPRPLAVEIVIAGQPVERRVLEPGVWNQIALPLRDALSMPYRRVDLRASHQWFQDVQLASRPGLAQRPISVMMREIAWTPVDSPYAAR